MQHIQKMYYLALILSMCVCGYASVNFVVFFSSSSFHNFFSFGFCLHKFFASLLQTKSIFCIYLLRFFFRCVCAFFGTFMYLPVHTERATTHAEKLTKKRAKKGIHIRLVDLCASLTLRPYIVRFKYLSY